MTYSPYYYFLTCMLLVSGAATGGTSAFFLTHNPTAASNPNLKRLNTANAFCVFLGCATFLISVVKMVCYQYLWKVKKSKSTKDAKKKESEKKAGEDKFTKHPMAFSHLRIDAIHTFVFLILWFAATILLLLEIKDGCPPIDYCYLGYVTLAGAGISTILYFLCALHLHWLRGIINKLRKKKPDAEKGQMNVNIVMNGGK